MLSGNRLGKQFEEDKLELAKNLGNLMNTVPVDPKEIDAFTRVSELWLHLPKIQYQYGFTGAARSLCFSSLKTGLNLDKSAANQILDRLDNIPEYIAQYIKAFLRNTMVKRRPSSCVLRFLYL